MPSGLRASAFHISDVLSGPFLLKVPVYQRPYSWSRDEAGRLLDDLLESAGIDPKGESDSGYFLGSILLMGAANGGQSRLSPRMAPREFDIIDGQQRLVTLLTLIAVLRDLETDSHRPIGRQVAGYITAQVGSRFFRSARPRILLASREKAFFEAYVMAQGSTLAAPPEKPEGPEGAILGVREHLVNSLKQYSESERLRLFQYATQNCEVVVILSEDIDSAYGKFIVLNERGKKLQRNDILKADVISRLDTSDLDWAEREWDEMSARLGNDFEDFFSHLRTIYGHSRPLVVSAVRAVMREEGGAAPFLRNALLPLGNAYASIRKGGDEDLSPRVRQHLKFLNRLQGGDWAPAAMVALKGRSEDHARAAFLLAEIDRMAHLLRLLCLGTGRRKKRFADIVSVLRSGEKIDGKHPAFAFSRDDVRNISFHLRDLHTRAPKMCKLLLLRLNDELTGMAAEVDPGDFTIEHILPQRPPGTSEWRQWYPTAEDRSRYIDSLGNMVLVSQRQNDRARNAKFADKKRIFSEDKLLPITASVLKSAEWRPADVEAREELLMDMIRRIWRIDLPKMRAAA